jgi:hypothetical protein
MLCVWRYQIVIVRVRLCVQYVSSHLMVTAAAGGGDG